MMISAHASHILPLSLSDSAPRPSMAYTVKWNVSRNTPTLLKDRSDGHAFEIRFALPSLSLVKLSISLTWIKTEIMKSLYVACRSCLCRRMTADQMVKNVRKK